ncbi:hypothetical protein NDU88_007839 [Pleurodeles waltl]|uniref:Uncharacterized protein n=1 Tax=Pleurodeles waltl TaxID=8319 RepID=A0AAV7VRY2_PLEWA|nr:hypothetical protein NDU88_007839 [Pleurodeles waltl]
MGSVGSCRGPRTCREPLGLSYVMLPCSVTWYGVRSEDYIIKQGETLEVFYAMLLMKCVGVITTHVPRIAYHRCTQGRWLPPLYIWRRGVAHALLTTPTLPGALLELLLAIVTQLLLHPVGLSCALEVRVFVMLRCASDPQLRHASKRKGRCPTLLQACRRTRISTSPRNRATSLRALEREYP